MFLCPLPVPLHSFTFLIGQCFLSMLCAMTWGVFLFFAGFVAVMSIFVMLCIPETKGVPIEEVDELVSKHWLWSRVVRGAERPTGPSDLAVVKVDQMVTEVQKSPSA